MHRTKIATRSITALAASTLLLWTATGYGQSSSTGNQPMPMHLGGNGSPMPTETGQSAFAAIAEIVGLLNADDTTDWSKVDISALRNHLVDMNMLMMGAKVTQSETGNEVVFIVEGEGQVLRAIQAMALPHARQLDMMDGWSATATTTSKGAVLTMKAEQPFALAKIQGLGFFGLMVTGAQHQPHHLALAQGNAAAR